MGDDLDLPDGIYGFGSWLLWMLATRAPAVVDHVYQAGRARASRDYGMVDGQAVPTPALVAWLLTAAQNGVSVDQLNKRDSRIDRRQKKLRTTVSRAVNGEPRLFQEPWLLQLAAVCGLEEREVQLLKQSRDEEGHKVDYLALRRAIAKTRDARHVSHGRDDRQHSPPHAGPLAPSILLLSPPRGCPHARKRAAWRLRSNECAPGCLQP